MEVKPVPFEVQPLFYKPLSDFFCLISFDGIKYYNFRVRNVEPYHWIKKLDYIIEYTDCGEIRCDGFYDRDKKVIWFFYNRKLYKLYKGIINHQKLERLGQQFLTSEKERKEQRMSVREIEGIKSNRVDLTDAPSTIVPTKIVAEKRTDKKDNVDCLYVDFYWMVGEDEVVTTLKYRPFHLKFLLTRMKELKMKNVKDWVGKRWNYEEEPFGKLGYGKYLPVIEE